MSRFLAAVFVSLLLVACSSKDKKEVLKPAKLVDFDATAELQKVWRVSAGSGKDKRYTRYVPAVMDDKVFVADSDGRVFAYTMEKGKSVWKTDLDLPIGGAVGAGAGMVLVGTYDGEVIALDGANGEERWRQKLSSEVVAAPQTNGDVVVAMTIDGHLFALDAQTGEQRWSYDHTVPVLTLRGNASPFINDTQVIAAFDNGQIVSLGAGDGSLRWSARASQPKGRTELERIVDIDGTPIVDGGFVYVATYQGNVAALSRGQGREIWKKASSTHQNIAISRGSLFVSTDDSKIIAYDADNGAAIWTNEQLLLRDTTAPATIGNYVAVVDGKGYLHLLSQTDGAFAYRTRVSGDDFTSPLVSVDNRLLLAYSDDGKLTAYKMATDD